MRNLQARTKTDIQRQHLVQLRTVDYDATSTEGGLRMNKYTQLAQLELAAKPLILTCDSCLDAILPTDELISDCCTLRYGTLLATISAICPNCGEHGFLLEGRMAPGKSNWAVEIRGA